MASRRWLYFGGLVVTGILLVGATLMGLFEGLSALSGGVPGGEEFVLITMLAAAAEWVVIALVLGLVAALFLAATVVSVLRGASIPRDDRLASVVERLERRYPLLRRIDAAKRVRPTTEERTDRLKEQYVAGEMNESEFEREMARVMDDASERPGEETAVERDGRSR